MYHVSTQGIDERMINVHYYYLYFITVCVVGVEGCMWRWAVCVYVFCCNGVLKLGSLAFC